MRWRLTPAAELSRLSFNSRRETLNMNDPAFVQPLADLLSGVKRLHLETDAALFHADHLGVERNFHSQRRRGQVTHVHMRAHGVEALAEERLYGIPRSKFHVPDQPRSAEHAPAVYT